MKKITSSIFILIYFLCAVSLPLGCTKKKAKVKSTPPEDAASQQKVWEQKKKALPEFLEKLKQKNPFARDHAGVYSSLSQGLTLSGIFYDAKQPLAIINGAIVAEGQMVGTKQVIKINKEEVILKDHEGREYRLKQER